MIIWKPLSKYRYSTDRNELKFHTDFKLEEGEKMEDYKELMEVNKEVCPHGKVWKFHWEMAREEFDVPKVEK